MFNTQEAKVLIELIDKEIDRINREYTHMDSIGDSFFINEGLIFENMHVRKKLEARMLILESIKSQLQIIEGEE